MNRLDLLYVGLAVAASPWWMRKARGGWAERFGRTPALPPAPGAQRTLLIHAVSVGEVAALRELVPLLVPECRVVISCTTDTGLARAKHLYGKTCEVVRYPLDFSWSVRRFLDAVRPDAVALVELEVWPNFIRECRRRGIPVAVINGRLSEKSFGGYQRIRRWLAPVFGSLEFAAVQDEAYAARFEAMGVDPGRCLIAGSMKWDTARIEDGTAGADDMARVFGIDRGKPLIVAGSTAEGEEALLHAACPPGVQLLCAPRKPERAAEAAAAMPGCTRRYLDRKTDALTTVPGDRSGGRFLLATIGELRKAYALADVVVVGRTFADLRGSDPIEPIGLGKPTVVGPSIANFQTIVETFDRAGAIVRTTRDELPALLGRLLEDAEWRRRLAERGRACIREHQGASVRHAELLLAMLGGGAAYDPGPARGCSSAGRAAAF